MAMQPKTGVTFIYVLIHPKTRALRYVGKANKPDKRWLNGYRGNVELRLWIQSLKSSYNLPPTVKVIECVSIVNWEEREQFWIKNLREAGFRLLNIRKGGSGRFQTSDELKKYFRRRNILWLRKHPEFLLARKQPRSVEDRRKMHLGWKRRKALGYTPWWRGKKHKKSSKLKMSRIRLGTKLPAETKKKMSRSQQASWHNEDIRQRRISGLRRMWLNRREEHCSHLA